MANFFPKWTNELPWKIAVCGGVLCLAVLAGTTYYATPKYTRVGYEPGQPVPFSHAVHVQQLGMDCRFCHNFVEVAAHANVPSAQTCMSCHQQIKAQDPKLAPVRAAWNGGKADGPAIEWVKVHQTPDYVYFNHAVHVNRGVSCFSCHGAVNDMTVISERQPLSMKWCLDCHRAPENFLRPPTEVFNMSWKAESAPEQMQIGTRFKHNWDVNPPTTCGGCHR